MGLKHAAYGYGGTATGTVDISYQSISEIRGKFHGALGGAVNVVDGCFDMFPLTSTINPTPSR